MQKLYFLKEWEKKGIVPNAKPIKIDGKPTRVWTLYLETDENAPPQLPFKPVHNHNAFLEDYVHDWNIYNGMFRYGSRVMDRPVWILLEYD